MKILKMFKIDDAAALVQMNRGDMEALVRSGAVKAFNLGSASAPKYFMRRENIMDYACRGKKDFSRKDDYL